MSIYGTNIPEQLFQVFLNNNGNITIKTFYIEKDFDYDYVAINHENIPMVIAALKDAYADWQKRNKESE